MICVFIDTSISFPTISIVKDDTVLFEYHEEIKNDMSSKILPILDEALIMFADNGYSGTNFKRPDFSRMMEEVQKQKKDRRGYSVNQYLTELLTKDLEEKGNL